MVHPKYVVVVCKLQFIGEKLFVCPPPTASGHGSKEHGYHGCTRIGHSRILRPIILGFKSAFGAILKDFGRYASLVGERKQRGELARQNPFKSVPKAHKIKYIKSKNP